MLGFLAHEAPSNCLFIHGAGGNNLLWARTLQFLSGPGKALALNLPGHPVGEATCRSISDYSKSVLEFISESGLRRVSLCGHSMGGAVALLMAIEHPEAVEGLVLVDGGAKLGVSPAILQGLSAQPLRAIEELITPLSFHSLDLQACREARAALSLSNLPVFINDYRACDGFDARNRLSGISAKTLIICGESDRMTPPKYSEYMRATIPNSTLHLIPNAGHMVPLEAPEALGRLVQSFLAGLSL